MLKIDTFSEKKIAFVSIDPILNTYIHITKSFLILRCQAIPGPCTEPEKQTKNVFITLLTCISLHQFFSLEIHVSSMSMPFALHNAPKLKFSAIQNGQQMYEWLYDYLKG